jgi:hypothetical protein
VDSPYLDADTGVCGFKWTAHGSALEAVAVREQRFGTVLYGLKTGPEKTIAASSL